MRSKTLKSISQYFKIWWIPILSYLIPIGILLFAVLVRSDLVINIFLVIFLGNVIGNLISAVVQIINKKWYLSIPQILISIFLFYYVALIFTLSPPDYYGVYKQIPKDVEISKPIEAEPTKLELEKHDLILGASFQPGIYDYYTDFEPKETGYFYIKAFEITSNDRLSEERIKKRSKVSVDNKEPKIYRGEFTIYEGSWGDEYGAKIELWFKPSERKDDYKIAERNYIVEGWMR